MNELKHLMATLSPSTFFFISLSKGPTAEMFGYFSPNRCSVAILSTSMISSNILGESFRCIKLVAVVHTTSAVCHTCRYYSNVWQHPIRYVRKGSQYHCILIRVVLYMYKCLYATWTKQCLGMPGNILCIFNFITIHT